MARWQSTIRRATCSPSLAVSFPPASIAWRASAWSALRRRVGGVEVAHLRVEVPAVVVELPRDRLHVGEGLLLDVLEAHHHVRHLHAGVVDVVLHPHVVAPVAQHAHERVAEAGVPEVADVGGLVRVDARVLDDDVARPLRRPSSLGEASRQLAGERRPVEEQVHVPAARDLRAPDAGGRGELLGQPLGDLAGLAAEGLREVEGGGQGEVAQLHPGRVLEGDVLEVDVEGGPGCAASPRRRGAVGDPGSQQVILPSRAGGPPALTSFDARVRYHERMIRRTLLVAPRPRRGPRRPGPALRRDRRVHPREERPPRTPPWP